MLPLTVEFKALSVDFDQPAAASRADRSSPRDGDSATAQVQAPLRSLATAAIRCPADCHKRRAAWPGRTRA
ncbi:MAG: hypothetical protein QOH74_779 [Gaiellales bacterium]|nr:hypothetical protein [Gaiellales bacterium]